MGSGRLRARFITTRRPPGSAAVKRRKVSSTVGRILFAIPVVVIVALVILGLASTLSAHNGTLTVEAVSSGRFSPPIQLKVQATVGARTEVTPFNLSLPQGEYSVAFGNESWYIAPANRSVSLLGGKTAYVIGTYEPIVRAISVTASGFNTTELTAEHGVTPVVWINQGDTVEVLEVSGVGRVPLSPSQNYTKVFDTQGTVTFAILNTGYSGTIRCV